MSAAYLSWESVRCCFFSVLFFVFPVGPDSESVTDQILQNFDHEVHIFHGDMLIGAVETGSSGAEIRAWQPSGGELGTICSATDGYMLRLETGFPECGISKADDLHVVTQNFCHVAILIPQFQPHRVITITFIQEFCRLAHGLFSVLESGQRRDPV